MNRKQLALLLFLLVVLGLAGLLIYDKQNDFGQPGGQAIGKKLLPNLPVNDIARIGIQEGTNSLNLVKKDSLWRVAERNNYPANYPQISELILKLSDLKVGQSEKVGPSQLPRLGLVPGAGTNAATVLELKDANDKSIQSLLLGKKHMRKANQQMPFGDDAEGGGWPDGRYVKVANSDSIAVISDALQNVEPKPEQWLNKDFLKVDKVRAISVTYPVATNSWKLSRETETGEWKLADAKPGEQLDTSKTSSLASALSSPTFNDISTGLKPEQLGLDKPTVVTLDTFDNFSYKLNAGQKTNDNYAITVVVSAQLPKERTPGKDEKPEDKAKLDKEFKDNQKKLTDKLEQEQPYSKWVYLVSSWTLDSLLKERGQLMAEKKEEKKDDKSSPTTTSEVPAPGPIVTPSSAPTVTPAPLAPPAPVAPPATTNAPPKDSASG